GLVGARAPQGGAVQQLAPTRGGAVAAAGARTGGEWSPKAEFATKMSTQSSCPWQGAGASVSPLRPDLGFLCSRLHVLALLQQVLGRLVWALIAQRYHLYLAYGWVMFIAVFLWLVTIVFYILCLFQLHVRLYMVPRPLVLKIFNVGTTILDITAFNTCSAVLELRFLKGTLLNNHCTVPSFFARLVMIAHGVSAFFSFQAWQGMGRNAATSHLAGGYTQTLP
ncbi:plasmolipin-like, partial [Mirounga leonina]|uniref:plasmolipin-like n=2 Tax=Mirounga TaxID=9714 RepID=UPI00156BFD8A